jgi:hypothetical protein
MQSTAALEVPRPQVLLESADMVSPGKLDYVSLLLEAGYASSTPPTCLVAEFLTLGGQTWTVIFCRYKGFGSARPCSMSQVVLLMSVGKCPSHCSQPSGFLTPFLPPISISSQSSGP